MTIIQKNKVMMGDSITQILDDSKSTWEGSALFTESVNQHALHMAEIKNWAEKQEQQLELKGLVEEKKLLRQVMIDSEMMKIVSALRAAGGATNNNRLITSVNKSRSKLIKMSDTNFNIFAGVLKGIADDNSAAILSLGVTAEFLNNYGLSCASFDSIMKKPKAMKALLKTYTKNLGEAVLKMVRYLNTIMDHQVRALYQDSLFMSDYFNSRKVYHYNEGRTELKGTVTAENGHHIKNAIIEVVDYPNPGERIFRHTNSEGHYSFKQLDLTTATIRIRAVGYIVSEYTVKIEHLKSNNYDIVMMRVPAFVAVLA